jgi:23S rRNA (guanosine2251-2'-O)-methyltransferase
MSIISGVHPVREALRAARPLDRVLIARGAGGPRLQEIIELCRERGIPVRFEPREALDRLTSKAAHQGVAAFGSAHQYADFEATARSAGLLVVLDGVEDPHNLGAIVRTANAAGADGVCVPERRSAGLSETVAKAAAGALEYTPVVRIGNVSQALEKLKALGFWIYGLDERGEQSYTEAEYNSPTAIVLGGEGAGVHQNVSRHCDLLVRIPMAGRIASLNVSVAAGVMLFELRRRAAAKGR